MTVPQLMFFARSTVNTGAVTGDGTEFGPILYDLIDVNVLGCYNATTGVFTAPSTAVYMFQCMHYVYDVTMLGTYTSWQIFLNNATTSAKATYTGGINAIASGGTSTNYNMQLGGTAYNASSGAGVTPILTVGDQLSNSIKVSGSGLNIAIEGYLTYWCCYKVT